MSIPNVKEAMEKIGNADPEKIKGVNAVILFDLTGENGGAWTVKIADGKADLEEGKTAQPHLTLSADSADLLALFNGELNPMVAVMQGKLKISGDMSLAMQLQNILV